MGLHIIQKFEPQAAARWLYSHERLKMLRGTLGQLRQKTKARPDLAGKVRTLMFDIAAEEDAERNAIMAISQVERRHRQYKTEKRLRRLCGPVLTQKHPPLDHEKPFISNWLLFFIGLSIQPRPSPSNSDRN